MRESDTLPPEPCSLCGHDQTIVRAPTGELAPTCICCGGAGLSRDRACRHQGEQRELRLSKPEPKPEA